ncbi:flagellar biosynthesis repressor FlbT [Teichococcus vastitatis]|uniref:flagellar biosynthesis repressor FlbT n=1 Tax=Teichococcus vastitatis TaxID=2307076 RepID=UPI000E758491|nr:flagellar biosynthesis repressor FlbT [Pseudoroseomonas vastitatis]
MSLILKLAPGERLFINGAVVTNGDRRAYLMVETKAQIVREKDVLQLEDASTPVRRAYFAAQNVLLNAQPALGSTEAFETQMGILRAVFRKSEHIDLLDEAERQMEQGNTYRALAALRELVLYESALLNLEPPQRFRREAPSRMPPTSPLRPQVLQAAE